MWAIIIMLVLLPLPYLWWWAPRHIEPEPGSCGIPNKGSGEPARATGDDLATLTVAEGQDTELQIGRDLRVKKLTLRLEVDGDVPREPSTVAVREENFTREDDARIPPDRIRSKAELHRGDILLKVCVDRRNLPDTQAAAPVAAGTGGKHGLAAPSRQRWPDPGTYKGVVRIVDERFAPIAIPISVTIAYPYWPYPTLFLYLTVVVGTIYVYILRRRLGDEDVLLGRARLVDFGIWLRTWGGIASIVTGSVGAVTAFMAAYINTADFGSSLQQWFGLVGAMFTAFVTVGSTPHIVASRSKAPTPHEGEGAEPSASETKPRGSGRRRVESVDA